MKKIVAFLLTFVMLFTMVACSSASGSNPTTVPKPSGDASGAVSYTHLAGEQLTMLK